MSYEDCGFKPGKINGPRTCRQCDGCNGLHHFYVAYAGEDDGELPDGMAPDEGYFQCKHCGTWAEMVDEDEEGES